MNPQLQYDAELYELIHRGTPGDTAFYVQMVQGAERVLELGCGYGRILQALSKTYPDLNLTGIDHHPGLLRAAQGRLPNKVKLLEGSICQFSLGQKFDVILAPYSTLWCLKNDAEVKACLECVCEHLCSGGRFIFDAYAADGFHKQGLWPTEEEETFVAEVHGENQGYRVFERSDWLREQQSFVVRYRYEPVRGVKEESVETVIHHRYLLSPQVRYALEGVGLTELSFWAGFGHEPWYPEADHLVVAATQL